MRSGELTLDLLRQRYQRAGGAVAFLDESYRNHRPGQQAERPFYTLNALIIEPERLDESRAAIEVDVRELTGGSRYWHTAEAYADENSRWMIREFAERIARHADPLLVSVQTNITRVDATAGMSAARNECIGAIARALTGPAYNARLMVMESRARTDPQANHADQAALGRVAAEQLLPPRFAMVHASPTQEKLLVVADVLAWSYRRTLAVGDETYFGPLRERTTVIHARTGKAVNESTPHMPQQYPGGRRSVDPVGGRRAVASESSIYVPGRETQELHRVRTSDDARKPTIENALATAAAAGHQPNVRALRELLQKAREQRANADAKLSAIPARPPDRETPGPPRDDDTPGRNMRGPRIGR